MVISTKSRDAGCFVTFRNDSIVNVSDARMRPADGVAVAVQCSTTKAMVSVQPIRRTRVRPTSSPRVTNAARL